MSGTGRASPWDLDPYREGSAPSRPPRPGVVGQPPLDPSSGRIARLSYESDGTPLLLLAGWTALLTVLTLGLYRFWMVTRLRRHYWRAIRLDGDPLEYAGRGIEKLLGFLLAIVVLAVYLGLVNLALTFVGLSYFDGNQFALQLSALSALPFLFYARYRARRYILARTRWRGIRFGMDGGAWGYAARALWYYGLALLSLGLLYPLAHFRLTRYMTDRTWFGDQRFRQHGSWTGLFARWFWLYVVALLIGLTVWGAFGTPDDLAGMLLAGAAALLGVSALLLLLLLYHVAAFRYFWDHRSLGAVRFRNTISGMSVLGIYAAGTALVGLCSTLVAGALVFGATMLMAALLPPEQVLAILQAMQGDFSGQVPGWPAFAAGALLYLVFFAASYAFSQVFVVRPIIRRMAEGMTVENPGQLMLSRQRPRDEATEAGGFADALGVDVGLGF